MSRIGSLSLLLPVNSGQFQKSHEDLSLFIVLNFQLMKIDHAILISVSLNFCVF